MRYASDVADALAGAEFVIEAIPENLELKQRVYAEYEQHIGPEVIIASNTSGIPATKIAANLAHPERVIVTHWSNPPHLIPMIEIVPGERTNQATIDGATAVVNDIGYYPCLLKKEVPGFVENRVLYAIMRECLALVDEGVVGMEELDLNVKWGIGYKLAVIPPMQLLDMAGMDIYTAVAIVPQSRPVQHRRGLADHRGTGRQGPTGPEDQGWPVRLHRRAGRPRCEPSGARRW